MKLQSLTRIVWVALMLIAAFVAGQHFPSAVAAQSHPKWEYQIVAARGLHAKDDLIDKINKLGEDGWEAVTLNGVNNVLLRRSK